MYGEVDPTMLDQIKRAKVRELFYNWKVETRELTLPIPVSVVPHINPTTNLTLHSNISAGVNGQSLGINPAIQQELYATAQERVITPAAKAGFVLTVLGFGLIDHNPRLITGNTALWYISTAENHLLLKDGKFPIPKAERSSLKKMLKAGVAVDLLYFADELPFESVTCVEEVTAEMLRPKAPPQTVELSRRLGRAGEIAFKVALAPVVLTALAAGATVAAGAAAAGNAVLLDPVLIGAVVRPGRLPYAGEPAAFIEIARWAV